MCEFRSLYVHWIVRSSHKLGPPSRTEISPKRLRGRLMAIPSLLIATGIAAGFFICYGSVKTSSSLSWRLPFALQTLFSLVLAIGCIFIIPFSPRWLMHKGRNEEAGKVLEYIDKSTAEEEKEELAVSQAESTTRGFKVQELWEKKVRMRTFLTVFMQGRLLFRFPIRCLLTRGGISHWSSLNVSRAATQRHRW
jgi:MFS family permease